MVVGDWEGGCPPPPAVPLTLSLLPAQTPPPPISEAPPGESRSQRGAWGGLCAAYQFGCPGDSRSPFSLCTPLASLASWPEASLNREDTCPLRGSPVSAAAGRSGPIAGGGRGGGRGGGGDGGEGRSFVLLGPESVWNRESTHSLPPAHRACSPTLPPSLPPCPRHLQASLHASPCCSLWM